MLMFDDHRSSDKEHSISTTELIGPYYRAWKSLNNEVKNNPLRPMKRRSSFIGSAVHQRAELVFKDYKNVRQEGYKERHLEDLDVWISGTYDIIIEDYGKLYIGDIKTGYGKSHGISKTENTIRQLSIYRWLNSNMLSIEDTAYIYFISQSNNNYETMEVELLSLDDTEQLVRDTIKYLQQGEPDFVDCNEGIKFNRCDWCEFECFYRTPTKG